MKRIILDTIKPKCLFEGLAENMEESVDDTGVTEVDKKDKKDISSLGRDKDEKTDPEKDKKKDEKKESNKDEKKDDKGK
jgi:hypothetical protein